MKSTADRLRDLREDNDLSQNKLATEFNISRSTVATYENGNATPSVDVLIKYADKFNVSVDYLLCRVDKKNYEITELEELKVTHDKCVDFSNAIYKIKEALDIMESTGDLEKYKKDK